MLTEHRAAPVITLKGHNVVLGEEIQTQNFNVYSMNEITIQAQTYNYSLHGLIKKLFSEENKVLS